MRTSTTGFPAAIRNSTLIAVLATTALLSGCAATSSAASGSSGSSASHGASHGASHTMPDGRKMSGAEHHGHSSATGEAASATASGPSEAARMVCEGQVVKAVTAIFALDSRATGTPAWDAPVFTCTYDIDGEPLTLTVHDVDSVADGERHFEELKASHPDATEIKGLPGLGMPAFSSAEGVVAFLREGKTLTVDATALPRGLGAAGDRTREQVAYSVASAVLTCWVEHD